MAINGAANAALFAIKILALNDSAIQQKLREYRANLVSKTREKMEKLKESGWPD